MTRPSYWVAQRYKLEFRINEPSPTVFYESTYAAARNWADELAEGVAWRITDLETGETVIEVNP